MKYFASRLKVEFEITQKPIPLLFMNKTKIYFACTKRFVFVNYLFSSWVNRLIYPDVLSADFFQLGRNQPEKAYPQQRCRIFC